ncbi:MAG: hypothetical protein Q8Q17_02520, partial [bacterium]|nr:hypothetical protein [bacterium]
MKKITRLSFFIVMSGILIAAGVSMFSGNHSVLAGATSQWIKPAGLGLIAPASGSSTACGQAGNAVCTTCSGNLPSVSIVFVDDNNGGDVALEI